MLHAGFGTASTQEHNVFGVINNGPMMLNVEVRWSLVAVRGGA